MNYLCNTTLCNVHYLCDKKVEKKYVTDILVVCGEASMFLNVI